jgi:hypothetical protein
MAPAAPLAPQLPLDFVAFRPHPAHHGIGLTFIQER